MKAAAYLISGLILLAVSVLVENFPRFEVLQGDGQDAWMEDVVRPGLFLLGGWLIVGGFWTIREQRRNRKFREASRERYARLHRTRTPEEKAANVERLRVEAEQGDPSSLIGYWSWVGEPVTDPAALVEGHVYYVGYCLAIYRGSFVGPKWEGMPNVPAGLIEAGDLEDRPRHLFEVSQVALGQVPDTGTRYSDEDFQPELRETGEQYFAVRSIPAPQKDALAAFQWQREDHLRWDRRRRAEGYVGP